MALRLDLQALRVSALALAGLEPEPRPAKVHSVFRGAVNVVGAGGAWVCLLPEGVSLHPYAVTVGAGQGMADGGPAGNFLGVLPDEEVSASRSRIEFGRGGPGICLAGAEIWDSRLGLIDSTALGPARDMAGVVRRAARDSGVRSLFLEAVVGAEGRDDALSCLLREETRRVIDDLGRVRRKQDARLAGPVLARLVGFGQGLTPSGDDFLVGLLGASRLLDTAGYDKVLGAVRELVPGLAGATTGVSGLMLRAAVAGHFPEAVKELLAAMSAGDRDAVREWAGRLAGLGASSGQDMLAGILFWLDD